VKDEVNQAVSAQVSSSGRAFEQFKEAINDEDVEDLLKDAQADPKGVAAQHLLKKVLPFLNISSRQFFSKRIQIAAHGQTRVHFCGLPPYRGPQMSRAWEAPAHLRRGGRKRKGVHRGTRHVPPHPSLSLGDT